MGVTHRHVWLIAGVTLFGLLALVLLLSPQFQFERGMAHMPVLWVVGILALAGVILTVLVILIERTKLDRRLMFWVVLVGLSMRLVLFPSTPVLEDDFYRYLWDGAVVSEGLSPYAFSPREALEGDGPRRLTELARNSPLVAQRINYPDLKTVYPPVAELGFLTAHWLKPWSLTAWKWVLLAAEGVSLWLLLIILRHIGRSQLWVAVYWWNPLLVKEFFNSAHVDALMIPFLLGALLFTLRRQGMRACVCLAGATGIKIWPILLLPVVLRASSMEARSRAQSALLFLGLVALQAVPVLTAGVGETSGFSAYARIWEMNDALFMAIAWAAGLFVGLLELGGDLGGLIARFAAGFVVLLVVGYVSGRRQLDDDKVIVAFLVTAAAVFMLSPTQFPWYYTWLVPFLTLRPSLALMLFTPLLCLYYTRFYFEARALLEVFDFGVVWAQYVPVWLLLGWQGIRRWRRGLEHA